MKKRILVTPLNWGLGHATRCIPIINALLTHGFEPIIASDGQALELLRKEFPKLNHLELPSYHISYPKKGSNLKLKLLTSLPSFLKAIKKEKKKVSEIIKQYNIKGIINDNRFGVFHTSIPCVYITHQLQVLSGNTTWLSSKWHQHIIAKFDECWVPDYSNRMFSGDLSLPPNNHLNVKYIGPLSRFKKINRPDEYDIMILLSGPEPQRSYLEEKLFNDFKNMDASVLLVRGVIEGQQIISQVENMTVYNFMLSSELEKAINESDLVVARSGYSTVMDLATLGKKAFFIPTPGQFEQEYLAKNLADKKIAPYQPQHDFSIEDLDIVTNFYGFNQNEETVIECSLFRLFECE